MEDSDLYPPPEIRPPAESPVNLRTEIASSLSVPIVGIGASAGGLEVFKRLLVDLPDDTGFALVLIQHLDPNHQSLLSEILARATAMPVHEASDGMRLEANHIYVIPENVDLTVAHGALKLSRRSQTAGSHMPIDRFLQSAADQCGSRAIGVILSGAGSDGSAGVEAIKAAGGVTFAQEAATAKFASMPQSAISTGCVDFILPPEGIAAELVRIGRHPYISDARPSPEDRTPAGDEERFAGILSTLHGATGIDFSLYRENMVKRRILRRLALCNINSLAEYGDRLLNDPGELAALQRDLFISVTSFFRDRLSFEHLKKVVFPRIIHNRRANDTIARHTTSFPWPPALVFHALPHCSRAARDANSSHRLLSVCEAWPLVQDHVVLCRATCWSSSFHKSAFFTGSPGPRIQFLRFQP